MAYPPNKDYAFFNLFLLAPIVNTYFFEKELGWDGICMDANPVVFNELKKNRKSKLIFGGAWYEDTKKIFRKISEPDEMLSGFLDTYSSEHLKRVYQVCANPKIAYTDIEVKCYDMTKLLKENNVTKIDLLSVDTEGSEYEIISNLDFQKLDIKVIISENNYNDSKLQDFLKEKNFDLFSKIKIDDVFINKKYFTYK